MIKFGTGGWRAIIGEDFTKANIQILAKAMADKMKAEKVADRGLVMGYDRRFLSKETVKWSCEVFAAEGIVCHFVCRSVPTPLIMNYVMKYDFPYGMMVTASHNPSLYNGIKVFTAGGRDADEAQTRDIERYIEKVDEAAIERMDYQTAVEQGLVHEFYPMNEYVDDILEKIDIAAIRDAGLRIVLDPMYGVSETALSTILITGRCEASPGAPDAGKIAESRIDPHRRSPAVPDGSGKTTFDQEESNKCIIKNSLVPLSRCLFLLDYGSMLSLWKTRSRIWNCIIFPSRFMARKFCRKIIA